MKPLAITIHGVRCIVQTWGADDYRVQRADSGAVLAQASRRFLAIARAAVLLHAPRIASRRLARPADRLTEACMNRYAAPGTCDRDHHRNHFGPAVLAALRLLDRVEDGQDIDSADVQLALEETGDAAMRNG